MRFFWYFYRESLRDVQDIFPYLFDASYENFHQLKESQSEEMFPPEQYMELIINVSIPLSVTWLLHIQGFEENSTYK